MAPEPPPILADGLVLAGKYRVLRLIGRGGMAEVYAAHHEILHQTVALKVLLPAVAAIPGASGRFLNEARSAARIRSEHVASVMDVGMRDDGSAYIVLEYLEGEDLQGLLDRRGPLPPSEGVDYLLQGLEALAHAHAIGIIHRDLKPSNIFLARVSGGTTVKVFDFGISKAPRDPDAADESTTASQMILGTPLYMAPEQARNSKDVDARSDIWALGVVLYRVLTGTLPFVGESPADVMAAILVQSFAPMRDHRPELSLDLDAVVARCLAKDRAMRFASVAELAFALAPHASAAGRTSIERIARTLGVSSPTTAMAEMKTLIEPRLIPGSSPRLPPETGLAAPAGVASPSTGKLEAKANTDAAWMESSHAKMGGPSPRRRLAIGGAVLALPLVAAAAAIAWRAPHAVSSSPATSPSPASVRPSDVTDTTPAASAPTPAAPPSSAAPASIPATPAAAPSTPDAASPASSSPTVALAPALPPRVAPPKPARAEPSAESPRPAGRPPPSARPSASAPKYDVLDQRN